MFDSQKISYLRASAILVIVFGHIGGFWFFTPYSSYLHVVVPLFFFLSGAVSNLSFNRAKNLKVYYSKRVINLVVPYYLLCLLCLVVFTFQKGHLPVFSLTNLNYWLQIRPITEIRPFPVGQVWFLNTLLFISLISPFYFFLMKKAPFLLIILVSFLLALSFYQQVISDPIVITFLGNDLYKPLIQSVFYIFGAYLFSISDSPRNRLINIVLILTSVGLLYFITQEINYDLATHNFPPKLFYVLVSLFAICLIYIASPFVTKLLASNRFTKQIWLFCDRHTFSIFILHTFFIYLVEISQVMQVFTQKSIAYGLAKFALVLGLTCIVAPIFSRISNLIIGTLIRRTAKIQKSS